jgi:hypothetical protein
MTTSKQMADFLAFGTLPQSTKDRSSLLDQLRNQILLTSKPSTTKSMTTKPTPTITASLTAEFMTWKRTHPDGTALQFVEQRNGTGKTPTPGAKLDPNNLPRLDNNMIDALAVTNALGRQKAAELAAASAAVSKRNAPRRTVLNRSKYSV